MKKLESFQSHEELNRSEAREKIAQVIFSDHERHFTLPELVKEVQDRFPKIGVATVYRNVPVLVQAGIVRESLSNDSGQAVYEAENEQHHDHIVCLDCDAIFEFHEEEIEDLQEKTAEKMGFVPSRHRHVIYAHCKYRKK